MFTGKVRQFCLQSMPSQRKQVWVLFMCKELPLEEEPIATS